MSLSSSYIARSTIIFCVLSIIASCASIFGPVQTQTSWPCVQWRNFSWLDSEYYEPNSYISQIDSDYDWWYDHCTAYTNPVAKTGVLGYVACGVSKYRAERNLNNPPTTYDERMLGGCAYQSTPLYSNICEDYDFGNHENCVSGKGGLGFNTIGRVDDNGNSNFLFPMNFGGEYLRVKQLKDGSFLTVGHSRATLKRQAAPQNGAPLLYNPTSPSSEQSFQYDEIFSNIDHRNTTHWDIMKFDFNGTCLFNNLYGQIDFGSSTNNTWGTLQNVSSTQASYLSQGVAQDFVQKQSGNSAADNYITIVGRQERNNSGSEVGSKASLVQITDSGFVTHKMFLDQSNDSYWSDARAISMVETSNPYYVVAITKQQATRTILELHALSLDFGSMVRIAEFGTNYSPNSNKEGCTAWNMVVQNQSVFIPLIEKSSNVWWGGEDITGELSVYKVSLPNSMPAQGFQPVISGNFFTNVRAFDLKARIARLKSGLLGIVSTVRKKHWQDIDNNMPAPPAYVLGCVTGGASNCTSGNSDVETMNYWNTDAFVAKINPTNLTTIWTMIFHSDSEEPSLTNSTGWRTATYGGDDPKHQECLYGISEGPNGSIVVSGNSSGNVDDNYMAKVKICSIFDISD